MILPLKMGSLCIVVLNDVIFKSTDWHPYYGFLVNCISPIYIILTHNDSKSIVYRPYNINIIITLWSLQDKPLLELIM